MKMITCESCRGIWIVRDEDLENQKVCPYCAASIQEKIEFLEYDSLDKAIYGAVLTMGQGVLQNPRQLAGFMMDTAPGLKKEIRIFAKTVNEDYVGYIKSAFDQDAEAAKTVIKRLHHFFVEEEGLSDNWANVLCTGLYGAVLYTKGIGVTRIINVGVSDFVPSDSRKNTSDSAAKPVKKIITAANRLNVEQNDIYNADSFEPTLNRDIQNLSSEDIDEALEQFRLEANEGYISAYNSVAAIYVQKKNYKKAWKWYLKSAGANDSTGQYYVGKFYQEGLHVKKDLNMAVKYYEKAANQGHVQAMQAVIDCRQSDLGDSKDKERLFGDLNAKYKPEESINEVPLTQLLRWFSHKR